MSLPIFLHSHQTLLNMKTILINITLFFVAVTDGKYINLDPIDQNARPNEIIGDSMATREQLLFRDWVTWMVSFSKAQHVLTFLTYDELDFRKVLLPSTKWKNWSKLGIGKQMMSKSSKSCQSEELHWVHYPINIGEWDSCKKVRFWRFLFLSQDGFPDSYCCSLNILCTHGNTWQTK